MAVQHAEFTLSHQSSTDRSSPARWVFSHSIRHWYLWLAMVGGSIVLALVAAVTPSLIGQAFNAINANPPQIDVLPGLALTLLVLQIFRGLVAWGRNFGGELLAQRMERQIRDELYVSLLGKSMTFHNLQPVGDTMARATNDVREVNFMFSPGLNMVIGSITFLIVPLFAAPRIHPALIITPLLFVVIYYFALRQYLKSLTAVTDEVRGSFGHLNTRLAEALDGIETVKGAAQEQVEVALFGKNARRYRDASVHQGDIEARYLPFLLFMVSVAVGLLHALILFYQGAINLGQVINYMGRC